MTRAEKVEVILQRLYEVWPNPTTELLFSNPLELLIAVMLSAQTTDKLVNKVTPDLFSTYKTAEDYANATVEEIDQYIKRVNYHFTKAKRIKQAAEKIVTDFHGEVPRSMDQLITLPGVGRKTASVVLGDAFNIQEGIAVDTHVIRLSQCFGLTTHTDPKHIEVDLMKIVPKKEWTAFSHLLILFGRYYCPARKTCNECEILGDLGKPSNKH